MAVLICVALAVTYMVVVVSTAAEIEKMGSGFYIGLINDYKSS